MDVSMTLAEIVEELSYSMEIHERRVIESSELSNLTSTQIHYIDTISHCTDATVSELAQRLAVTKPTVTIAVEKLRKLGYVEKTPSDADKRYSFIKLTAQGKRVALLHDDIHSQYAGIISQHMTNTEIQSLTELLMKALAATKK